MQLREKVHSTTKAFQRSERLEAFSDGVFAIVITLLVLELRLPELVNEDSKQELFDAVFSIRHKLFTYMVSFLFIGQLWVAHANFFRLIVKTDTLLFWINNLLLMFVSLIPFPTAMMGDYIDNPGSVMFFGMLFTATGFVFGGMSWYCYVRKFYHPNADYRSFRVGSIIGTVVTLISLAAVFIASHYPHLALGIYFCLIVTYILMQSLFKVEEVHD